MSKLKNKVLTVGAYVGSVVAVNAAFAHLPAPIIFGEMVPVFGALLVGFIFVARDYAQREIGHWVIAAMIVAIGISFLMASPKVAMASAAAFAVSEAVDWVVYTITKRPLSQRILLSSSLAVPIDTALFLFLIGYFGWVAVALMSVFKLVAAVIIYLVVRRAE